MLWFSFVLARSVHRANAEESSWQAIDAADHAIALHVVVTLTVGEFVLRRLQISPVA
jgi:hypothetical protein